MTFAKKTSKLLGFFAGICVKMFGKCAKKQPKKPPELEFKTSAQRLGLTMTDRIRDIYRKKWIKKS